MASCALRTERRARQKCPAPAKTFPTPILDFIDRNVGTTLSEAADCNYSNPIIISILSFACHFGFIFLYLCNIISPTHGTSFCRQNISQTAVHGRLFISSCKAKRWRKLAFGFVLLQVAEGSRRACIKAFCVARQPRHVRPIRLIVASK